MNDNCVALKDWAETAETSSFNYLLFLVRSEPKSFDIELKGSPENLPFHWTLSLREFIVTFYVTRLLKLQPKTEFTDQGIIHISTNLSEPFRLSRSKYCRRAPVTHEERKACLLIVDQRSKAYR